MTQKTVVDRIGNFIASVLSDLLASWPMMLLLGGLHRGPWPQVPALGYWWTFGVLQLLCLAYASMRWTERQATR